MTIPYPSPGNKIEIRFNNGVFFDAIVEYWSDTKSVVRLLKDKEIVVIQKTLQDVLLVKIYNDAIDNYSPMPQIEQELEILKQQPMTAENLNHLVSVRNGMSNLEKQDFYQKVNSQELHETTMNYELPRNIQIARPTQYPRKEAKRTHSKFAQELSNMFNKKD